MIRLVSLFSVLKGRAAIDDFFLIFSNKTRATVLSAEMKPQNIHIEF